MTEKRALVTGAARRLGRSMAVYLAENGHDVAVHYHGSAAEAESVVDEIRAMGRKAAALSADLTLEATCSRLCSGRQKPLAAG